MTGRWRILAIGVLAAAMLFAGGAGPSMAQSRAHVYLLRGLMNIFSLGMDSLGTELDRHGVYTTVDSYSDWQSLADGAAARYKAGSEGPIILIGHSLGADAVMEMAAYLGRKGVPVALVVPFDGTQSFYASPNVAHVLNITQRSYAYMHGGAGFHGTLINMDVSSDRNIDHITIDKSPRLHARVISEVLAVIGGGGGRRPAPGAATSDEVSAPGGVGAGTKAVVPAGEAAIPAAPAKAGDGAMNSTAPAKPVAADGGTPTIAAPERATTRAASDASTAPPPRN